MSDAYLVHHGIPGQKWGKRNGPPYPLNESDKSSAEKKEEHSRKGLSNGAKTAIKIGAIAAGVALVGIGAYKLSQTGQLDSLVRRGVKSLPKQVGGLTNPKSLNNNCKECSEATIKRWLGVDPNAVAGEREVKGNLHDFISQRGYNPNGITWIGSTETGGVSLSGEDNIGRISRNILKKCKDGDCGIIAVDWDLDKKLSLRGYSEEQIKKYKKMAEDGLVDSGHAFNFYVSGGKVQFYDDQPDTPLFDASSYLNEANKDKIVEICKITKEAFTKNA